MGHEKILIKSSTVLNSEKDFSKLDSYLVGLKGDPSRISISVVTSFLLAELR